MSLLLQNWDGSGGNGAAVRHFEETGRKFPLAVKLGTITPHSADVFSYAEDDMVTDPKLVKTLPRAGLSLTLLHILPASTFALARGHFAGIWKHFAETPDTGMYSRGLQYSSLESNARLSSRSRELRSMVVLQCFVLDLQSRKLTGLYAMMIMTIKAGIC